VRMHALNLALRSVHTHSNGVVVCTILQNTEEFGWCAHKYEYKLSHDSVFNGVRRLLCVVGAY
jgi:hypothetical protein